MYEICSRLKKDAITASMMPFWVVLVSSLLTFNAFQKLFWCFYCWLWTRKYQQGSSAWNKDSNTIAMTVFGLMCFIALLHFWFAIKLKVKQAKRQWTFHINKESNEEKFTELPKVWSCLIGHINEILSPQFMLASYKF